jgi:hypothetical protein
MLIEITSGNLLQGSYYLFPALKQNLDGHKFKDCQELYTVVTQCPITRDLHKCLTCHKKYMEK